MPILRSRAVEPADTENLSQPGTPKKGLVNSYLATVRPLIVEVNPLQTSDLRAYFRPLGHRIPWMRWK